MSSLFDFLKSLKKYRGTIKINGKKSCLLFILNSLMLIGYSQKNRINIASELNKLAQIKDLPTFWEGTGVRQVSSYDTTGRNDDGFSGKYSFVRRNSDSSLVIFDVPGNGSINRIWTPTPTDDTLDFYFGGINKPSFSICFSDLFSGKIFPFVSPLTGNEIGGFFCYFPIPFKNGCKIVSRGKQIQFFQIQYRSYSNDYQITNFVKQLDDSAMEAFGQVSKKWNKVDDMGSARAIYTDTLLLAGQSVTLAELDQGGRILGIKLQPADAFKGLNKQIDLKISWDNEKQPAVYMPVADFFGYAYGKESMQSLLLGTRDNVNYCYFPMPFNSKAKIELIYRPFDIHSKDHPIKIKTEVFVSNKKLDSTKEGKFYAFWNADIKTPLGKPHVFLQGFGHGHYVGTILQAQGLNPGMTLFFEGDDVSVIDNEMRIHGTGSEDYFNGGWYALLDRWDKKMSFPLFGSLDYSLPYARTGGYRLFVSDKMPFEKSIYHTIEHGPEKNNIPGNYVSVSLYYARKSINQSQIVPTNSLTKVFIADTFMIYPQLMKYNIEGTVEVSNNRFQSNTGGQLRIDLSDLPTGQYQVFFDIEKSPDGADIFMWQRQRQVSKLFSFYATEKKSLECEYICDINIDEFQNTVTVHFKKDKIKSAAYIKRLILIRKK
jgi:hypothetical protein